jgi:hypothetical protein
MVVLISIYVLCIYIHKYLRTVLVVDLLRPIGYFGCLLLLPPPSKEEVFLKDLFLLSDMRKASQIQNAKYFVATYYLL